MIYDWTAETHQPPSVITALTDAMQDLRAVEKDGQNERQGYTYRRADDLMNAVGPVLRKHRIVISPNVENVTYSVIEVGRDHTPMNVCRMVTRFDVYGPAGDSINATIASEAFDSGDKAATKASTIAMRTMLGQLLAVATQDTTQLTPAQLRLMQTLFRAAGMPDRPARLAFAAEIIGRDLDSSKDLTASEAHEVIDALKAGIDEEKPI